MGDFEDKGAKKLELGPEITGTILVGGRKTSIGRLYPMKLLRKIASEERLQSQIRTLTFMGQVRRPGDTNTLNLRDPVFVVTYLGVEEKELRVAVRLLPKSFPDQSIMRFLPEAHKAGSAVFTPVGQVTVDANGIVGVGYKLERVDLVLLSKQRVDLPNRYVPKKLGVEAEEVNVLRPVMYGVGIEHKPNEFGMTHGIVADVAEMLEVVPDEVFEPSDSKRYCLLRYNPDGTHNVLYTWHQQAWHRESE